jgi:tetratricopeptide (TPR) repeat protein
VQKYARYFPGVDAALGASYAQIGLPGEAESYYAAILADDPDNSGALSVLGHLKLEAGDTTEAMRLLTRAIAANPAGDFNPYADLANIHQVRGELAPVLELLEQWLRYHPDDERVRNYVRALTGRAPAGSR